MRVFASWWERVPVQQVGAVIAVVMLVGMVGAQFSAAHGSISAQTHLVFKPAGEVWH
jgi:hypothetical protein